MKGKMPRLPVYGPPRTRFSKNAGPTLGQGGKNGEGKGDGAPGSAADVGEGSLASGSPSRKAGEASAPEAVPEAYREAVKRFFSAGDESPANGSVNPKSKP